jgi:hypothetical protein
MQELGNIFVYQQIGTIYKDDVHPSSIYKTNIQTRTHVLQTLKYQGFLQGLCVCVFAGGEAPPNAKLAKIFHTFPLENML